MSSKSIGLSDELHAYLLEVGAREPEILRRLRDETAVMPQGDMQIAPEQGQFMGLLVELMGVRRYLEVGTFTGYSSLSVVLRLPSDGRITCCDVSEEWTAIARRYWQEAGVADRVELLLGPATETLDRLIAEGRAGSYDMAFIDADKQSYPRYYEQCLDLLRAGGLLLIDNVLRGGRVVESQKDEGSVAIDALNRRIAGDERVSVSTIPLADGLTLARKR